MRAFFALLITVFVALLVFVACGQRDTRLGAGIAPIVPLSALRSDAAPGTIPVVVEGGSMVALPAVAATVLPVGGGLSGTTADATVKPLVLGGGLSGTTADATVTAVAVSALTGVGTNGQVVTKRDAGFAINSLPAAQAGAYTPGTLANWSDAGPTSIANALDRLAAKAKPVP